MPEPSSRSGIVEASLAALALGALSTFGDWVWAGWIPDGAIIPGVIHGIVFFAALALALAWGAGEPGSTGRLLRTLPLTGLLLAAAFYPLAAVAGYLGALLLTWTGMWLALAWLLGRALPGGGAARGALLRGLLAAAGSGVAFWAVSGMWTRPAAETGYALRFLYWTLALLPGLLALLVGRRREAE